MTTSLAMLTCVLLLGLSTPLQADAERVLCRKDLPEGRQIVVYQTPPVEGTALRDLLGGNTPRGMLNSAFSLNVDLHAPSQPPLTLFSRVCTCWQRDEFERYAVLDLLVRPNQVVIVVADGRSDIAVIELGQLAHGRYVGLGTEWSQLAAAVPTKPGRLGATLKYNETTGRIEIVVADTLEGVRKYSAYQQEPDQWKFKMMKQWDVPAGQ